MRRNRGGTAVGYTLVEVLIFVALTSALIVIAIPNLNAAQKNTQFTQAIRNFESQLSDIINDTPTGYFEESTDQTCAVTAGSVIITDVAPTTGLGENNQCVYVGKAIQFNPEGTSGEEMHIYSIAGRRVGVAFGPPVSLTDADPTAVASSSGGADTVEEALLPSGLQVTRVFKNSSTPPIPAASDRDIVAILTDIDGATLTDNGNAQTVQIGGLSVAGPNNKLAAIAAINGLDTPPPLDTSSDGIVICLQYENDRRASVTVGATGSPGGIFTD